MKAGHHPLDGAREVELQVSQPDIGLSTAPGLYLDDLLVVERNELVAIPHQDVEVGVDHRGLVALRDPKRLGTNPVYLIGLLFQPLLVSWVHHLGLDPSTGGHLVLPHHVFYVGHQRRQQWVSPAADIPPKQQRLLQVLHQVFGSIGQAELALGRQVQTQARKGEEPCV